MDTKEKAQAAYAKQREEAENKAKEQKDTESKDTAILAVIKAAKAQIQHREVHEPKVEVKNFPDIAQREDITALQEAITSLEEKLKPEKEDYTPLLDKLQELVSAIECLPKEYPDSPEPIEEVTVKNQIDLAPLAEAINKIDFQPKFDPKITVKPADVKTEIDLEPIVSAIQALSDAFKSVEAKEYPEVDLMPVIEATRATTQAINNLQFPVPNYILPFKDPTTGKATQVTLGADGSLPIDIQPSSGPSTSSVTSVADATSSTELLAANTSRLEAVIVNDSTAVLYVAFGETASSTNYTARLVQYGYLTTQYTGQINGIWASDAGGNARITELT